MRPMPEDPEKWFEVSLRVSGRPLDFASVSRLAGIEPTDLWRTGDHRLDNPRYAKYVEDVWIWRVTQDSSEPFEPQLRRVVAQLKPSGREIVAFAKAAGGTAYLFLGYSSDSGQGVAEFPADLLLALGQLDLDLVLDLYPPWGVDADA
jgi:hypothetical protein